MNCSQILPGAVNSSPSSLATGYCFGNPFVVYASGKDVILLDGHLHHLQTIFGATCGYGDTKVSCLHCAEASGQLAVAWGTELVIFEAVQSEYLAREQAAAFSKEFLAEWNAVYSLSLDSPVTAVCWNREGSSLLTGGNQLILWEYYAPWLDASAADVGVAKEGLVVMESVPEDKEISLTKQQEVREEEKEMGNKNSLREQWRCDVSSPLLHVKFSSNGELFATCAENDCLVKIWYPCLTGTLGIGTPASYSFCYVAHPQPVRGFVWRRVTPSLPKGCIPRVLLTHCVDNICRLWSHAISTEKKDYLRFFIAASIDPVADIPFRTTMPLDTQPFIVHWLNNKETTLTSKVEKYQKGLTLPMSHFSSLQSFTSNVNEEILQSWVCIDEDDELEEPVPSSNTDQELGDMAGNRRRSSGTSFLSPHAAAGTAGVAGGGGERSSTPSKSPSPVWGSGTIRSLNNSSSNNKVSVNRRRALAHLLDEWCNTPDLLLCIHPTVGSLMVWTVEGLDAPPNLERLVHVSFSSCLPHIFPPHLSQSLRQDLFQFLIKEPDVLHNREGTSGEAGSKTALGQFATDISIPVPQIRLSSGGSMSAMTHLEIAEDVKKIKSDSTLILVSSHTNGSLNTWSVELTMQSNYCTSIAGLIHCEGTGGHRSRVEHAHRHPWLPIVMTVSTEGTPPLPPPPPSEEPTAASQGEEEVKVDNKEKGVSELIIWNSNLPGPLLHKCRLNELSRMVAPNADSFNLVTWLPPISEGGLSEGGLARCPSLGLFVANVRKELLLFQASLYSITKPQPSSFMQSDLERDKTSREPASNNTQSSHFLHGIEVTSQLGVKGINLVSVIEHDLSRFDEIVGLHAFRMCSLVSSLDVKDSSLDPRFFKDVVLVLVENKKALATTGTGRNRLPPLSPGSKGTRSHVHMWRLTIHSETPHPSSPPLLSLSGHHQQQPPPPPLQNYTAFVREVFSAPFPLPVGTSVVESSPACDISSSLQLQTPTVSSPFLFLTSCSDGTVQCWQFRLKQEQKQTTTEEEEEKNLAGSSPSRASSPSTVCSSEENEEFELYEVFNPSTRISDLKLKSSYLDCYEEEVIKSLPTQSYIPSTIKAAYPGRLALAHLLSKPITSSIHRNSVSCEFPSRTSIVKGNNPLDRYAMVTVWECESSGGLKWACEATITLVGVAHIAAPTSSERHREMSVLIDWIPMENGAYLLATCFASMVSIFGMSLPQDEEQFTVQTKRVGFLPREKTAVLKKVQAQASWICLLQFPCFRPSPDLSISCLAYTGTNSIVISMGSELHLYSCWVQSDKLVSLTPSQTERNRMSKGHGGFVKGERSDGTPARSRVSPFASGSGSEVVNLLDYAHARNTPLPQYHPKILTELMNSGKLLAVKAILVNLIKFLFLYKKNKKKKSGSSENYFDRGGMEGMYEDNTGMTEEERKKKKKQLMLSPHGYLHRSKQTQPEGVVGVVPHLSLAKTGIVQSALPSSAGEQPGQGDPDTITAAAAAEEDDYDELFTVGGKEDYLKFSMDDDDGDSELGEGEELDFASLEPGNTEFSPKLAKILASILDDHQLADLSDLEQIRLLSIADTVASTKMSINEVTSSGDEDTPLDTPSAGLSLSILSSGAGYASSVGSKGREAMDDCGMRYLLALEGYLTISESLPEDVSPGPLPPSVLVWAFHSDAETDLLSMLPCVKRDELNWEELRNAGVGWWLRSLDTLRRLIEKLAKTQFMRQREPLDTALFYLAMKKQSLLRGLFKSVADVKKTNFFSNNFAEDYWKNKAQKNAFVLLGKQRFEEAAAFFLLADKLWDAVEVCISNLRDYQLALVVIRLYEGDNGPTYQRFLKEFILGIQSDKKSSAKLEAEPDPFLRSMACWLLQDYSSSLETLLMDPESLGGSLQPQSFFTNPAVFNFYFYLRLHPFLVRRDNKSISTVSFLMAQSSSSSTSSSELPQKVPSSSFLSGVGDEPLTAVERSLLFSTAYYHLCHGCPLLVLNVLSRLPKSERLGTDVCEGGDMGVAENGCPVKEEPHPHQEVQDQQQAMIESGVLGGSVLSQTSKKKGATDKEEDFDWGAPVMAQSNRFGNLEEEEEFDWSKPVLQSSRYGDDDDDGDDGEDIDWSQPVSSHFLSPSDNLTLSPPHLSDSNSATTAATLAPPSSSSSSSLGARGLFVLSLAEQLQYNACLSILTEELHSIYVPSCCLHLWETKGRDALPILPLSKHSVRREAMLTQHYADNIFDKTVQNLRGMLMDWLREETKTVKELCRLRSGDGTGTVAKESAAAPVVANTVPAGYDLLTTLMNYASLHASTSPSLLTVKFELMHLMNTLLPWSTGSTSNPASSATATQSGKDYICKPDTPLEIVPTYALDPSQLPVLTSCSLPVRHLTNLATHLRLLSCCITKTLTKHMYPPTASQPLPQAGRIFELCCAISHCVTVSLNPMLFSEILPEVTISSPITPCLPGPPLSSQPNKSFNSSFGSLGRTPTPSSSALADMQQREAKGSPVIRQRMESFSNLDSTIGTPNTRPSKWPGVSSWPCTLTSDEGRDPTPLSVVLVECIVSIYLGLFTTAWSRHSVKDLFILLKNSPSMNMWYSSVGGGVEGKKSDRILSKSFVSQTIENVTKKFQLFKRSVSPTPQGGESSLGVFVAPKKTLLDHFLTAPAREKRKGGGGRGRRRHGSGGLTEDRGFYVVSGDFEEELENEDDDNDDEEDNGNNCEEEFEDVYSTKAISFTIGGGGGEGSETDPKNPDCFVWCLMDLCISKFLQQVVRKMVAGVGLEVLELVTMSPLLYSTLKILDEWESAFTKRLDALGDPPDDIFEDGDDLESSNFRMGLSLMRHKFILEPENSPFRGKDGDSRQCKKLWEFLVHEDESRETIIHYIFTNKSHKPVGSVDDDTDEEVDLAPPEPTCKVIHKEADNTISAFCLNSCSRAQTTVLALALPREVMEIEVPDNSLLDNVSSGSMENISTSPKRSMSLLPGKAAEDFIMVQSTAQVHRSKTTAMFSTASIRRSIGSLPGMMSTLSSSSNIHPLSTHQQTGSNNSLLIKRPTAGVRRMAPHPSLAYYLTGSLDGSVIMWEFGTPRPVATQREPGLGGGVTKIRFTPEGNKFGVTDSNGKLSLWQGIQTSSPKNAYHILHSFMRYLSDFLFLGSSSFIATCGDGIESRNLCLWDTLMPTNRSIVKEFTCQDNGATSLGYSHTKQRLFCGGKKGEVCVFDIRQFSLLHSIPVHTSSINCMVVNDIDGYFVTGAADGDVKIIDLVTLSELAYFPGQHAKSRLFRHGEGGVTDLDIMPGGKLYSCGADGSIKCQTLKL